jgi:hypothetical protein
VDFIVIWYIFTSFGILCRYKSGNLAENDSEFFSRGKKTVLAVNDSEFCGGEKKLQVQQKKK